MTGLGSKVCVSILVHFKSLQGLFKKQTLSVGVYICEGYAVGVQETEAAAVDLTLYCAVPEFDLLADQRGALVLALGV